MNKKIFGIECLGCGLQRSVAFLFQGEFYLAYKMYPAIYSIIVLLLFILLDLFFKFRLGYKIKLGLIFLTSIIIVVSYFIKMNSYY
ncbi:DUF2752 domain-containing protein [Jejudonia soesokkakensis]|uniref:DUF2752 domain-containing protein n=1 Tax=Jejudonia soesokkakensis TaxID=1323432 RepID=A0ABW2MU01_9FLAO